MGPDSGSKPDDKDEIPTIDASDHADTGAEDVETGQLGENDEDKEDSNRGDDDEEAEASTSTVDDPEQTEEVDGWKDDEFTINFSDLMIKEAHDKYQKAKQIMSPD